MGKSVLRFNRELYPREALMKAAYHFIDRCFVHVDIDGCDYVVEMTAKESTEGNEFSAEFENELLAQAVRYQVYQQTHTIREILMARAMSSTITGGSSEIDSEQLPESVDSLENILKDWFKKNED